MGSARAKRWGPLVSIGVIVLILGGLVGFQLAVRLLRDKVTEALGPESELKLLRVRWSAVEVEGLRIKGRRGWPATDALRAERVRIVPSLRGLFSGTIRVGSITILRPYLSALRGRDGRLQVVPSLLEGPVPAGRGAAAPPARTIDVSSISLEDGVVEIFDATVAQPPLKIRLEQIRAAVRDVTVPTLSGRSRFELSGLVKGIRRDGRLTMAGWAEIATKDSSVKTELRSMDLVALQPYFAKAAETRVQKGTVDLDLASEVRGNRLRAPGKVVISDLEFAPARGAIDTFMGVPRGAVVNFLKNRDNRIAVNFTLEGDINNPRFALNEAFATRLASGLAENLGVSLRGVAEGVGSLGQKGVQAGGEAVKGVGDALQQLLGGRKGR